jgi:transcription initiation factor TFIID TATA-box-binding protein
MTNLTTENIVASAILTTVIDLKKIATALPDATYNPSELPALIIHTTAPVGMGMVFADGSVMCTGAKSIDDAALIMDLVGKRLFVAGVSVKAKPALKIHTIVASVDFQRKLDLKSLSKLLKYQGLEYNPKQFPGLIISLKEYNTVMLFFDSGKMVCTGPGSKEISRSIEKMTNDLSSFGMI